AGRSVRVGPVDRGVGERSAARHGSGRQCGAGARARGGRGPGSDRWRERAGRHHRHHDDAATRHAARPGLVRGLLRRWRVGGPRAAGRPRAGLDAGGLRPGAAAGSVRRGSAAGRTVRADAGAARDLRLGGGARPGGASPLSQPGGTPRRRRVARARLADWDDRGVAHAALPGAHRQLRLRDHVAEPRGGRPDRGLPGARGPRRPGGQLPGPRQAPRGAAGRCARPLPHRPRARPDLRRARPPRVACPGGRGAGLTPRHADRDGGRVTRLADAPWGALRAAIRVGAGMVERPARPFLRLDTHRLVETARRRAGTDDEDTSFLDGLHRLVESLETEANLNLMGRIAVREDIIRLLANRFRVEQDRRRDPGIAAEDIRRPIFITGMPRSGSTLLHGLLAQDPANRVPQTWEMLNPSPAPQRATYDRDPRIAKVERELWWFQRLSPSFQAIHDVGARMPEECVIILAHSLVGSQFASMYDVPSYSRWGDAQDARPGYELHRRFLQHLQHHCRGERWVLKAPVHLPHLGALLSVYPDARVIMTHREPLEVLGSEC